MLRLQICCREGDTILTLKRLIKAQMRNAAKIGHFKLTFNGRPLRDVNLTLEQVGIGPGSVVAVDEQEGQETQ